ncbi:glycoside hydrolase family 16 protein [Crepidotus variabilis]|uniref:Glycoside hydrolase family 16 protein n=1 Tax=Crepidotus variabilis TaxID=179855 RepID=A0A9P6ECB8_9AGAR|nr:glycoside hydrolase family 16 protein [Crepidotus variabilis]
MFVSVLFSLGIFFSERSLSLALPNVQSDSSRAIFSSVTGILESTKSRTRSLSERGSINYNPDGTPFLWLPQDEYSGTSFYDRWNFFNHPDPTNFLDKKTAFDKALVSIDKDGTAIMKADDFTSLERGKFRDSIRIESIDKYTTGLFVLDLKRAPWGCAVWPAFWTVGSDWPWNGEIDIIEGVHDNEHNQVAWHTAPDCNINTTVGFSGSVTQAGGKAHTDCNAFIKSNAGCSITEWSRASYGPYFDSQGGGVFVMKWDENDISIWSFFRAAVPKDIIAGQPNPSLWGVPSARLHSSQCSINKFFKDHSIIFDITFCGDWAGNSYATSGCPDTCEDRLMNPKNFENATWSINSLKVYRKQVLAKGFTQVVSSAPGAYSKLPTWGVLFVGGFVICSMV